MPVVRAKTLTEIKEEITKTHVRKCKDLRLKSQGVLVAQLVKNLPAMQETWARFLGQEDPLEK